MSKQLGKAFGTSFAHNVDSIGSDEHITGPNFYPNSYHLLLLRFYDTYVNSSEQGEFLLCRRVTRRAYADRFVTLRVISWFSSVFWR